MILCYLPDFNNNAYIVVNVTDLTPVAETRGVYVVPTVPGTVTWPQAESTDLITACHYTGNILFWHSSRERLSSVCAHAATLTVVLVKGQTGPDVLGHSTNRRKHSATWPHLDWSELSLLGTLTSSNVCFSAKKQAPLLVNICLHQLLCALSSHQIFLSCFFNPFQSLYSHLLILSLFSTLELNIWGIYSFFFERHRSRYHSHVWTVTMNLPTNQLCLTIGNRETSTLAPSKVTESAEPTLHSSAINMFYLVFLIRMKTKVQKHWWKDSRK